MAHEVNTCHEVQRWVYREVLKMSPALVTEHRGTVKHRGDALLMESGRTLVVDRELAAGGEDVEALVRNIVENLRPSFGFMSNTSHFALAVLAARCDDITRTVQAHIIWGVS